jgi:hypothetical protein
MLTQSVLRDVLLKIFFDGDEAYLPYVVPLIGNWWQPTSNPGMLATYIGYSITGLRPELRTVKAVDILAATVQTTFRIAACGPQAEEIIHSTLFWDERSDVKAAFAATDEQLNYTGRHIYPVTLKQDGFNDSLCWVTNIRTTGTYRKHEQLEPWFPLPHIPY